MDLGIHCLSCGFEFCEEGCKFDLLPLKIILSITPQLATMLRLKNIVHGKHCVNYLFDLELKYFWKTFYMSFNELSFSYSQTLISSDNDHHDHHNCDDDDDDDSNKEEDSIRSYPG